MALAIHGLADPKILETYEQERGPVAKAVIKMSSNMFAMGFSNKLAYRAIRKTVTAFISLFVGFIAVPAGTVSMVCFSFDHWRDSHNLETDMKVLITNHF